jgi:predicted HicB family RNase H-like nuclease
MTYRPPPKRKPKPARPVLFLRVDNDALKNRIDLEAQRRNTSTNNLVNAILSSWIKILDREKG